MEAGRLLEQLARAVGCEPRFSRLAASDRLVRLPRSRTHASGVDVSVTIVAGAHAAARRSVNGLVTKSCAPASRSIAA
jgi:hypothetical protein